MSEEIKRSLEESIVLHNMLLNILPKMMKNNKQEYYTFVRLYTNKNSTDVCDSICKDVSVNLLKEIFTLLNQVWSENPTIFNEGLIKERGVYNIIKSQIKGDRPFPFNNKELYKRIRESIVHNSIENPNFTYDLKRVELNLGKVNGEYYIVEMSLNQMYKLIHVLLSNFNINSKTIPITVINADDIESREDIKNNIKMLDDKTNEYVDLDNNQVERIYNYFRFVKKEMNFTNEEELKKALCFSNNSEKLLLEKFQALTLISKMGFKSNWKSLLKSYETPLQIDEILGIYNALVSNLLFTYASSQTNEELYEVFKTCIPSLDKDNVRHFRNALCHGRYFHDFSKNFYFYDGKKNLSFELKLSIDNINKFLDRVAKESIPVNILIPF